jgi:hypothetical protein
MSIRDAAHSANPPKTRAEIDIVRAAIPEEIRATGAAPSSSTMGRTYRRQIAEVRQDQGDNLLDAANANEIVVPDHLAANIIFDGHIIGQRCIVFMTEFGSSILENYGAHISVDGTFKAGF